MNFWKTFRLCENNNYTLFEDFNNLLKFFVSFKLRFQKFEQLLFGNKKTS